MTKGWYCEDDLHDFANFIRFSSSSWKPKPIYSCYTCHLLLCVLANGLWWNRFVVSSASLQYSTIIRFDANPLLFCFMLIADYAHYLPTAWNALLHLLSEMPRNSNTVIWSSTGDHAVQLFRDIYFDKYPKGTPTLIIYHDPDCQYSLYNKEGFYRHYKQFVETITT